MGGEGCANGGGVIGVECLRCGEGMLCLECGGGLDYNSCSGSNSDGVGTLLDSDDWVIDGNRLKAASQTGSR